MHGKRWLTGIVAVPLLVYFIGFGPRILFYVLLYGAAFAALTEYFRMTAPDLPKVVTYSSYVLGLLIFLAIYVRQFLFAPIIILIWAMVPMTIFMLTRPAPNREWTAGMAKCVFGLVYLALPLALLMQTHLYYPSGKIWIFFLLIVIFATDTGAFYFGRHFGRHRLYERISPKKTWEGAIGGLFSSLLAGLIFAKYMGLQFSWQLPALIITLSVAAQIGDLAESALKRNHGIKDSGRLLPGHGGILDRIDGLLFAIPVLSVFLTFVVI
jgi:phosphatidate cytidylyltransferase